MLFVSRSSLFRAAPLAGAHVGFANATGSLCRRFHGVTMTPQSAMTAGPSWHAASGVDVRSSFAAWSAVRSAQADALLNAEPKKKKVTEKSMKLKRDPAKPKRALSAWMHFLADFRLSHPITGESAPELTKRAAVQWKALADKSHYDELAAKSKAVYQTQLESYKKTGAEEAWKRPPGKPKKPMTAFIRFTTEYRDNNKSQKMTDATKAAAAEWKAMSEDAKLKYQAAYEEEKIKYDKEMEAYKATGQEELWKAKVGINAGLAKKAAAEAKAKAAKAAERAKERKEIARLQARAAKLANQEAKVALKAAKTKSKTPGIALTKAKAALAKAKAKAAAAKATVLAAAAAPKAKGKAKSKVKAAEPAAAAAAGLEE